MTDIERRTPIARRRVSRNGRRVTDPATPAVGDCHEAEPGERDRMREPAPAQVNRSRPDPVETSTVLRKDR
jgi:hypothetical protein